VFLVAGGEVPYLLRPHSDEFLPLEGTATFHSTTDDEAVSRADITPQKFLIR